MYVMIFKMKYLTEKEEKQDNNLVHHDLHEEVSYIVEGGEVG